MQPYDYTVVKNNYFEFITEAGTHYACYFLFYADYFVHYKDISEHVYGFNVEIIASKTKRLQSDERIGRTVLEIVRIFLESLENAVLYVCDSSDGRELFRKRKFDAWFKKHDDGTIIKVDGHVSIEDFHIYNAILIHKDNPHKNKFIEAFTDLNSSAGDK